MPRSLAAKMNFLPLQMAVFCAQCEMIGESNTPRCMACGSLALLSLSRVLGGSLSGQQTAHLIHDAEINHVVCSLLDGVPQSVLEEESSAELPVAAAAVSRHHLRVRGTLDRHVDISPGELEPGISIITEKAQTMTNASGAAIGLRNGNEIICHARAGRTAPDLGARLEDDSSLSAECVRTGEVLLCNDTEATPRVDGFTCRRLGVRSVLAFPLCHSQHALGVFEVFSSQPNAFDRNDILTLQFLSGMMVAAMSRLSSVRSAPPGVAVGM